MDIPKKLYQELPPKERAIATFAGFSRNDWGEVRRLIDNVKPADYRYRQAIVGLRQALETYNFLICKETISYLSINQLAMAATCYCEGWAAAGGSRDDKEYRMFLMTSEYATTLSANLAGAIKDIQQAAREWCEKNQIPVEIFSLHCVVPILNEMGEKTDSDMLSVARSAFDTIKLDW